MTLKVTVFALLIGSSILTFAADDARQSQQEDQLINRLDDLEKRVALQEKSFDLTAANVDRRLSDFGILATMQGSQTSWVSNTVALMSVLITLIIAAAGALTYISVTRRITSEAEEAASRWLTAFRAEIEGEISVLDSRIKAALKSIAEDEQAVRQQRQKATSAMDDDAKATRRAADAIMRRAEVTSKNERDRERKSKLVQKASEDLKMKPESEFGAEDYYIRGVSLYSKDNFKGALHSFESALDLTESTDHQNLIRFRVSKAQALEKLGEADKALALYRSLDEEYRDLDLSSVSEHLSKALINMSIIVAKKVGLPQAIELSDELRRRYQDNSEKNVRRNVAQALFNKSYWLGVMLKHEEAIAAAQDLLKNYEDNNFPDMQPVLNAAELNMAGQFDALSKFDDALPIYSSVSSRHAKSKNAYLRLMAARAYSGKIVTLKRSGREDLALEVYKDLDRYVVDSHGPIRVQMVSMLRYKASLLGSLDREAERVETFNYILDNFSKDADPAVRVEVANSILYRLDGLRDAKLEHEDILHYKNLIELFANDKDDRIVQIINRSRNSLGYLLLLSAKKHWDDFAARSTLLSEAEVVLVRARKLCDKEISAIVDGNLAYVKFMQREIGEFEQLMESALSEGGEILYEGQLADGALYQTDLDGEYTQRISDMWQRVSAHQGASTQKKLAIDVTDEM